MAVRRKVFLLNIFIDKANVRIELSYPDSKVHRANMGPTWVLSAPAGPHVGPMNLAIRVYMANSFLRMMQNDNGHMP